MAKTNLLSRVINKNPKNILQFGISLLYASTTATVCNVIEKNSSLLTIITVCAGPALLTDTLEGVDVVDAVAVDARAAGALVNFNLAVHARVAFEALA